MIRAHREANAALQSEVRARNVEVVSRLIAEAIEANEEAEPYEFYEADWANKILDAVEAA